MNSKELDTFGYIHSRKLTLSTDHTILIKHAPLKQIPESLCVYYDVLVDDQFLDNNNNDDDMSYGQFYDAITASSRASIRSRHTSFIPSTIEQQRRFVKNDERRDNLISEFILTEDNYVASLRAFITTIVHPIRTRARDKQKRILGPYECGKVFMNIEQILQVNEAFRLDLARYQSTVITGTTTTTTTPSQTIDFGEMCLNHLRRFVSYYHKFLLGVENAQTFNTKEQKDNPTYDAYLDEVKGTMGNQTVYDYLALPGQRVGRYTMFLKELIKHTTDDHSNLPGLTEALKTAEEIADMSEDYHTKLIKIFHNMLQSIQHCPASLLSQQRSLICHLDASELDPHTLRPVHPVTLFLFTDKLMVVRRPSYVSDGLELCGLDQERDKTGMLSLLVRKAESSKRYDRKLKFRGWISLNDIEIHDGAAELPTSFTLVTSVTDTTSDTDPQTRDALEGYFLEDSFRLFHLSEEYTSKSIKSLMEEKENFVEQFGKAKSGHKRIDDHLLEFTHGQWKGRYFFANIYRLSTYQLLPNKSAIAIAYLEGSFTSLKSQLSNCFTIPHMLGFIIPNKNDNIFRFSILSKLALGCISDDKECILDLTTQTESTFQQFRDRFLGNLYACDKDLREVGRMATSLSLQHRRQRRQRIRYTDNTKSMRMALHKDLSRKPSRTFKFFNNLGNSNNNNSNTSSLLSPSSSPSTSTSPIPSSATTITTATMPERRKSLSSDEFMKGTTEFLESRISNQTFSSNGSLSETEDPTTIVSSSAPPATTTVDCHSSLYSNTAKRKNRARATTTTTGHSGQQYITNTVRRKSLTETIASAYRPSIHPTQSVSYEISPKGSSNTDMSKQKSVDGLEERIKQLTSTLQKFNKKNIHRHSSPIRPRPNNFIDNNNNNNTSPSASSSSLATRSNQLKNNPHRHSMSLSPDQYNSSGFTTLRNSSRETLLSMGGVNNGKQQQQQQQQQPPTTVSPSVSHDLMNGKQTQVDDKISELLAHIKSQSPLSTTSTDSSSLRTPSPAANTTDLHYPEELEQKLIAEMDTIKSEFSRRYNSMINDYEEMGAVVRQLNKALKKKDDELSILRIRYQDAMAENDLLYEAFNNELDHMYDLFEQRSTRLNKREYSSSSLDDYDDEEEGEEEEQREQQENIIYHTHQKRPAHPSPEAQIRKKLELTIKERNQWHKTACKLARELQSLSQSTGNRSITPTSSSSTSSLSTTTGHGNNDNIRPGNSRSTPLPPFRHSTN